HSGSLRLVTHRYFQGRSCERSPHCPTQHCQLLAPIDSPQLSVFVNNRDRINALADEAPGFIWRLQTEEGDATGIDFFGADYIVNLSVWSSIEALNTYVYHSAHVEVLRRKKE